MDVMRFLPPTDEERVASVNAELHKRFAMACRRCHSTNVVIDVHSNRLFVMGCNTCCANDFMERLIT